MSGKLRTTGNSQRWVFCLMTLWINTAQSKKGVHIIGPMEYIIIKHNFIIIQACTSLSGKDALAMSSKARIEEMVNKNSRIWPLSFSEIQTCWKIYNDDGFGVEKEDSQEWVKCEKTIRTEILWLGPWLEKGRKRRKTLGGKNCLLTIDQLKRYNVLAALKKAGY